MMEARDIGWYGLAFVMIGLMIIGWYRYYVEPREEFLWAVEDCRQRVVGHHLAGEETHRRAWSYCWDMEAMKRDARRPDQE